VTSDAENVAGELPGEPIMWILIGSELAVFGGGLGAFLGARALDPATFAAGAATLDRTAGALNTLVLVTSGFCAAVAALCAEAGRAGATRAWLGSASALGLVFLLVKAREYADKAAHGIGIETDTFFTFYYLLTGFHALHVAAGMIILGLVAVRPTASGVEAGAQFWHMVDLVWVLLFPVVYLMA
jgi:nitric oxide reductase NorE protein